MQTRLSKWLSDQGLTFAAFGRLIGTGTSNVRRYCLPPGHSQRRIPDEARMVAIYRATRGAVTPSDFYDLPPLPECAPAGQDAA